MGRDKEERTASEGNIQGTNVVKENELITKEEILFNLDVDGKAIPEKVDVDVYDKDLDTDILCTTIELDNALSMHESLKKTNKTMIKRSEEEIAKVVAKINELKKLETLKPEQQEELENQEDDLQKKESAFETFLKQSEMQVQAYEDKIKECRKDLDELEGQVKKTKQLKYVEATPCTVVESKKYFEKFMWKNDKGEWIKPDKEDDITFVDHLLADKVVNPKLTAKEWAEQVKDANVKLCIKDALASISGYKKQTPKEILVDRRRSEKLKNILGESQG